MFTREYDEEIRTYFDRQMELLRDRKRQLEQGNGIYGAENPFYGLSLSFLSEKIDEISQTLASCSKEEAEALRFLYSAMPVSDMVDYPSSLFLAYARHAAFLWNHGPFAGRVPEKIFANYVLHHRADNEDMTETRAFFYEKVIPRITGMSMEEAAMEANCWCAEEAAYHATDSRSVNPVTVYRSGTGRCGEESVFTTTVLRSLGIPARQVYAPLWSHCNSNHAWLEAWCDGRWRVIGACEPEADLDLGWFMGPAARAMQVHSTWFGKDKPLDQAVGKTGISTAVNHLDCYAKKGILKVHVRKESGEAVPGARVEFKVLNDGGFGNVATLMTGSGSRDMGMVSLFAGYGSLLVCAFADGCYGESLVRLTDKGVENHVTEAEIIIRREMEHLDEWREMVFYAPAEASRNQQITQSRMEAQEQRTRCQAEKRNAKIEGFYCAWEGERVLSRFAEKDRAEIKDILLKARGNMGEIIRFLEYDFTGLTPELDRKSGRERWKLEALKTLREKDYWDIRAEVLAESCVASSPYADEIPGDVFYPFLLCPRVEDEMLRPYRQALSKCIPQTLQDAIRRHPGLLPDKLGQVMVSMPEQEYGSLLTSPVGCLTGGIGSGRSQAALCVKIYRALGIPSRLRAMGHAVEYYKDGSFHICGGDCASSAGSKTMSRLILHARGSLDFYEWEQYSISRYENGRYKFLFPEETGRPRGKELAADLEPGLYRAITTNRHPNGDQYVRICDFRLEEGEEKDLDMELRDIPVKSLYRKSVIEDCRVEDLDGKEKTICSLAGDGRSAFIWLQVGKEPTEHVLNELMEQKTQIEKAGHPIYLIAGSSGDYKQNETLKHVIDEVSELIPLVCSSAEAYRKLSESVGQIPGELPLALVLQGESSCIFSNGGYSVGIVVLLLRILSETDSVV